jgi:hypothetical protein
VLLSPAMADPGAPKFKTYAEGQSIPSVDPEDIKRTWEYDRTHSKVGANGWESLLNRQAVCSAGADVSDVSSRCAMVATMTRYSHGQLVAPWQHGEKLDDAVFRVAAILPLRHLKHESYKITGDDLFPFDPNAFVQQLIDQTGISHVWEPVATKMRGRIFTTCSNPESSDPDRDAKRQARELLWMIWKRFAPSVDQVLAHSDKEHASEIVATLFADFLMDNIDLVRQVEASFRAGTGGGGLDFLEELERKAQGWDLWKEHQAKQPPKA